MKLTNSEIKDIIHHLNAGRSLPEKYRFNLFPEKHSDPDRIPLIIKICQEIENAEIENARARAQTDWPFEPQCSTKRNMTPNRHMELMLRDGFIDRYTGQRLLYPGTLILLSVLLPEEFPYHRNGKLDSCHMIHWDLYPSHDHIQAAALGGSNRLDNLITCSMLSNARKGHWTLSQLEWELTKPDISSHWDGQTAWFVRMIGKIPNLIDRYKAIEKWHKVAKRYGF